MRRTQISLVVSLVAVAALSACSDDAKTSDPTAASDATTTVPRPTDTTVAPTCDASDAEPPEVVPVTDVESDLTLTSFDGSQIRVHWFPARNVDEPAATLLEGPGWSQAGATDTGGSGLFGDLSVASLRDAGYNVVTWDPRGFGESTGTVTVNSAEHEGRDVQRLLDWLAAQPEALLDAPGDPRVGMLGGSYGGGIANIVAAIDCRVDAIAPTIAWNSLRTSLYKGEIVKQGWGDLLYTAAQSRDLDPHIVSSHESGGETGTISDDDIAWYEDRGPGELIDDITVPTLIIQGTVDTLFTLDEAVTNFASLRDRGVPVAMLWYCGGHGVCLSEPGDSQWTGPITMNWFDHYLRGNDDAPLPATFMWVDQRGDLWSSDDYPTSTTSLTASGAGALDLVADGGSGPASEPPHGGGVIGGLALAFTPARATNAVEVTVESETAAMLVGAPTVRFTYSGTVADGDRPTRVFAQLVDDSNDLVLGNQVTPLIVELDGAERSVEVPLEMVAHHLDAGGSVTLQLVATTTAYAQPRLGGSIEFSSIEIELPVIEDFTAAA